MGRKVKYATAFGKRGLYNVIVVAYHHAQAFFIFKPDLWQLHDHRTGLRGRFPGKGFITVACLLRVVLQALTVLVGPAIYQASAYAPQGL